MPGPQEPSVGLKPTRHAGVRTPRPRRTTRLQGLGPAGGARAFHAVVVAVLVGKIDALKGFFERCSQLKARVVIDYRAGVIADLSVHYSRCIQKVDRQVPHYPFAAD